MSSVTKYYHSDPGHGWIAVKRKELEELGIAEKISSYSYEKGATVYLEEDMDASTYIKAMGEKGVTVFFRETYKEYSPVRSYARYHYVS